jgi:hypothetical protein
MLYFNSIRELGHAATLIRADISNICTLYIIEREFQKNEKRYINVDRELTSRINSSQITDILEMLQKEYPKDGNPIDVVLQRI